MLLSSYPKLKFTNLGNKVKLIFSISQFLTEFTHPLGGDKKPCGQTKGEGEVHEMSVLLFAIKQEGEGE